MRFTPKAAFMVGYIVGLTALGVSLARGQENPYPTLREYHKPLEVYIQPMGRRGVDVPNSWEMVYHNLHTRSGSSDMWGEYEALEVDGLGELKWRIFHTSNAPCSGTDAALPEECADQIEVIAPSGYIAVPSAASVLERDTLIILIVPETLG